MADLAPARVLRVMREHAVDGVVELRNREIGERLGLADATVSRAVRDLLRAGMLRPDGPERPGQGKARRFLLTH